ncbi:MAG: ABC transporter ATP-binding protein [Acetilactobacillus jinshanensis]
MGKSTLVKMLIGQLGIDGGNVSKKNGLRIGYLAQNTGLHSNRTVKQEMEAVFSDIIKQAKQIHQLEIKMGDPDVINDPAKLKAVSKVYDQMQDHFNRENGYGYKAEIRGVLHGFGFTAKDYDRNINDLSGGQQSQLALAKLLLEKRDLLILDEPTNHIDVKTVTWLENYLKGYPGAFLVVSHDRYFLDKVVNEVYLLSGGTTHHYYGNYTQFKHEKQKRYKLNMRAYRKQQAKVHRDKEFIKKNIARASTSRRAQSRRKQLAKIKLIPKPLNRSKVARFRFHTQRSSGDAVLTVRNLTVGYHNHVVAGPISFSVKRGDAIAIIGPNGIGKSTLLRTIIHDVPKIAGVIQFGTGVSIGYYDQKQATLHPQKTVLGELWDEHPNTDEGVIRSILGSFLFSGDDVNKKVSELSGGEKARLQLTKLSMQHSNFLLLDEPTNHLDIASREVLENALRHFQGTILFVSHDRYFINKIATAIIELSHNGAKLYLGNYDYYVAKKDEERLLNLQPSETMSLIRKSEVKNGNSPARFKL